MILLDFSQVVISNAIQLHSQTGDAIDIDLLRHIALNNISAFRKKFNTSLDELIICCDSKNYWRKQIFPLYKQNRKKSHDESKFDWEAFFSIFNQIKTEFKTELPLKVIEVAECEADDVIAVLSQLLCPHVPEIIIVSSDKDLIQIQDMCTKVKQWSPIHKKFINKTTSDYNLFHHVVRGDSGDGIPNIISDDDVFMNETKRSRPMKTNKIKDWEQRFGFAHPKYFCLERGSYERFERNRQLIDLSLIPEEYVARIKDAYISFETPNVKIFNYLVKHKLRKLIEKGI